MSLVMKLWDPRKEDDLTTYDFIDIDELVIDDGIYGFETLENDDPPGDPNNNALKADFDFGDETGVDPQSYVPDDSSIDFEELSKYVDPDPEIDKYNFIDIDETELPIKDPEALEHNFGNEDKNPYIIVPEYFMKRVLKDSIRVLLHNGEINVKAIELLNPLLPWVEFQMYYNIETNKCFMEYRVSAMISQILDIHNLQSKINGFINANFKYDLGYIPEVITVDDEYKVCDNSAELSPYTIGYWKSIAGRYRFLEDQTQLMQDMRQFKVANHGDEYKTKYDTLYNTYNTTCKNLDNTYRTKYVEIWYNHEEEISRGDFTEFNKDIENLRKSTNTSKGNAFNTFFDALTALNIEYKINPDQKPEKSVTEFIDIVIAIRKSYAQTLLSETDKQGYITEAMDLYVQYYTKNPSLYEVKMSQLNTRYFIKQNLNSKVPDIYTEYFNAYYNFFNRELPEVNRFVEKRFMAVVLSA